jgi:hypothetical protein
MFIVTWLFDKLGYMPKISVDTAWSFPVAPKATKVAKKTTDKAVKIPKATTRTPKSKK